MLLSETTRIFLVGISKYMDASLDLLFASSNTHSLIEALTTPHGCAIPPANIVALCDKDATKVSMLRALEAISTKCGNQDTLIFYFSGHGEQKGERFYLLPHDVDLSFFENTSVSLDDLQQAMDTCKALGVLFILDCCRSAGFAEHADTFFRTLTNTDFRLMISGSRSGQLSYEFDKRQGTLFTLALIDALLGRAHIGLGNGVIYFSDLFRFTQLHVAEGLEALGLSPSLQEPVFAGTYSKDPRLFILNRLTLERVEAETPRYSRLFLKARVRRALMGGLLGLVCLFGLYYIYLDHSYYVWSQVSTREDNVEFLSILRGDPALNAFGFPHLVFTTDIRSTALAQTERPGVGSPPVSRFGNNIREKLYRSLSPEWKSALAAWSGDQLGSRWAFLDQIARNDMDVSGLPEATAALASDAGRADLDKLEQLIFSEKPASSFWALRALTALNSSRGIGLLQKKDDVFPLDDQRFTLAVLEGLRPPCNRSIRGFLESEAAAVDVNTYMHDAWFSSAARVGCILSAKTYLEDLSSTSNLLARRYDMIGALRHGVPADFSSAILEKIRILSSILSNQGLKSDQSYDEMLVLVSYIKTVESLNPASLPEEVFELLASDYKELKVVTALALIKKQKMNQNRIIQLYPSDIWIAGALAKTGLAPTAGAAAAIIAGAEITKEDTKSRAKFEILDSIIFFLRMVRLGQVSDARHLVVDIAIRAKIPELRIEAKRTLMALDSHDCRASALPSLDRMGSLFMDNPISLKNLTPGWFLDDSKAWFIRNDRDALVDFMKTLGDSEQDAAQILGRVPLTAQILADVRHNLDDPSKKIKAATILAMRGDRDDLLKLLTSADYDIRNQALDYVSYNPRLIDVITDKSINLFGSKVFFIARRQLEIRQSFERIIREMSIGDQDVELSLLARSNSEMSYGTKIAIQDEVDSLDGGTSYIEQNIDIEQLR